MANVVSVVLRLTFTRLSSGRNGVAEQGLAAAFQILGINGQEILRRQEGAFIISLTILVSHHWEPDQLAKQL